MAISRFISCFNVTILKETEISQVSGKWKKSKTSPLLYININSDIKYLADQKNNKEEKIRKRPKTFRKI